MNIRLLYLFSTLAFVGCTQYSFDINSNEIYSPPEPYMNFSVADPSLQTCLEQTILDRQLTSPTQLRRLQCSYSGIEDLQGIEQFSRIEQLSLKGNKISDVNILLQLVHLQLIDLSENPISDCQTLKQLEAVVTEQLIHTTECN